MLGCTNPSNRMTLLKMSPWDNTSHSDCPVVPTSNETWNIDSTRYCKNSNTPHNRDGNSSICLLVFYNIGLHHSSWFRWLLLSSLSICHLLCLIMLHQNNIWLGNSLGIVFNSRYVLVNMKYLLQGQLLSTDLYMFLDHQSNNNWVCM